MKVTIESLSHSKSDTRLSATGHSSAHLLQGDEQGLEAGEVSHKFEDPEYPHDADQADDLPCLADHFKALQPL